MATRGNENGSSYPSDAQGAINAVSDLASQTVTKSDDISAAEFAAQWQMHLDDRNWNKKESELAYQRSLPEQQIQHLMATGMSRAAALRLLAGGQYNPSSADSVSPVDVGSASAQGTSNVIGAASTVASVGFGISAAAAQWFLGHKQARILDLQRDNLGIVNDNLLDNRAAQELYGKFSVLKADYDRSHPDRPLPADIGKLTAELGQWDDPESIQDDSLRNLAKFYNSDMREALRSNPYARLTFRNMFDSEYAASWYNDAARRSFLRNYDMQGIQLDREATALQSELINIAYQDDQRKLELQTLEEQINKWKNEIIIGKRNAQSNAVAASAAAKTAETGVLQQNLRERELNLREREFSLQYSLSQPELEYAQLKIDALYAAYVDGRQDLVDNMASQMRNDSRLQDVLTSIEVMKATSESDFMQNHPHLAGISTRARMLSAYGDYTNKFLNMRSTYWQASMYRSIELKNGIGALKDLSPGISSDPDGTDPADIVPFF